MSLVDDIWAEQPKGPDPPGPPAAACRAMLVLWAAWLAYMAAWVCHVASGAPSDGFVVLLTDCGCHAIVAICFFILLVFTGFELWMFAASCLLRLGCWLAAKWTGSVMPAFGRPLKTVRYVFVGFHVLMLVLALYNSVLMMLGAGAMLKDPHGGVVVMGIFAVPIVFGMCLVGCGFCASMCAVSYFITGAGIKWVGAAWLAAFGKEKGQI